MVSEQPTRNLALELVRVTEAVVGWDAAKKNRPTTLQ
jgi:hypothetical protein